ncbi:MAG: carboxymuconolactone decarboxylase family protein [Acidimicrobiales bacterium]
MLDRIIARAASLATGTQPAAVFGALGRHPRLFRAWLPFAGVLLLRGDLPRSDAELVVLRTAWNCRCRDEWQQHAGLARRAGLTAADIEAIRGDWCSPRWSPRQRCLLRAADELHRDRVLGPETSATLDELLTERQRIELYLLVGHYEMVALLLSSAATGAVELSAEVPSD